jgi:ABC-type oligopeptide transport system substrate-binding subunit
LTKRKTGRWLAIAAIGIGAVAVPVVTNAAEPQSAGGGGELIDGSAFVQGSPTHLDPALNSELDSYQVIRALYDGLTDMDAVTDPANPVVVPHQAESYEPNEDASVWTFHIREGLQFADGEPILPSTYVRSWNRAATLGGDYSYLFELIEGGAEVLEGTATEVSGVVADDEAMTLTVTLSAPLAEFDAVAGFQLFRPTPEAAVAEAENFENTAMVGSGAYTMEAARNDEEVVLVKNDTWGGDFAQNTWDTRPDRIVFRIFQDSDTAFAAMEAGEIASTTIPSGRFQEALDNWGSSVDTVMLGSYHFEFDFRDPIIAGEENVLLRQAVSQAIDRDAINDAVFDGVREISTGITPPGIPGFKEGICQYCAYDPAAAQAAFDEWIAAGNTQSEPLPIQYNEGSYHGDVVAIMLENLAAIGIEAVADPQPTEGYFGDFLGDQEGCVFCRVGWYADYPTYSNFTFDIFSTSSLGLNNYGYSNPAYDDLVAEAMSTTDPDLRASLYNEAEALLLNTDVMVVPLNWYVGDQAWDEEQVSGFDVDPLGLVHYESVVVL